MDGRNNEEYFNCNSRIRVRWSRKKFNLVYYYMVRKEILLKQVIGMGWKKAIAAGIMFVFVFTIGKSFSISIFYTFVEILIGAIVYVIVLVVLRDAFVCKYIDKTFHKILGQRRK